MAVYPDILRVQSGRDGSIREMTVDDLGRVIDIEIAAYEHPWTVGIFRDCLRVGYSCWVYQHGQQVIAYGIVMLSGAEAHVLNLCVHPDYQSRGIGRLMLNHLTQTAREAGADTLMLVLQYADGGSMSERIGGAGYVPKGGGRRRARAIVRELLPVVDGVTHLHRNDVVHRDLKPDNILFVGDTPKVCDLGIAREAMATGRRTTGAGTEGYDAPGQLATRHRPLKADDVYALGLILHEMLTGRLPRKRGKRRELKARLPAELRHIIEQCLEPDPTDRLPDAAALGEALRAFLSQST